MKLSVEKKTAIWIKIGFIVVFSVLVPVLIAVQSYFAFAPLGILIILLGYILLDFGYLREKPKRLAIAYVILILLSYFEVWDTVGELNKSDKYENAIFFYGLLPVATLVILVYFLILKRVKPVLAKPVLSEAKQHQEKHLDIKALFPMIHLCMT